MKCGFGFGGCVSVWLALELLELLLDKRDELDELVAGAAVAELVSAAVEDDADELTAVEVLADGGAAATVEDDELEG